MAKTISVVIDKSYLQGCQLDDLKEITKNYRILVTAELGCEIFTTQNGVLKRCFNNLLNFREHIDLIDHLGTLFKVEIENQIPCSPISNHFLQKGLNPNFNFSFTDEAIKHITSFENDIEISGAQKFDKIVLDIQKFTPSLKIEDIRNPEIVRAIYGRLNRSNKLPPAKIINEQWAIFRRLQVDLIATIEYLQSFNGKKFNITKKRKEHNQIDFRICTFASLSGAVASNDKLIKRYFKYICPNGLLFTLN